MTNADRIRVMSDEELAEFLEYVQHNPCEACCNNLVRCRRNNAPEPVCKRHFLEWLREETIVNSEVKLDNPGGVDGVFNRNGG